MAELRVWRSETKPLLYFFSYTNLFSIRNYHITLDNNKNSESKKCSKRLICGKCEEMIEKDLQTRPITIEQGARWMALISQTSELQKILTAYENGATIFIDDISREIKMKQIADLVSSHHYWQSKNGNYYTYLPDPTRKNGRVQLKRKTEAAIKRAIEDYYISHRTTTFDDVYNEWMSDFSNPKRRKAASTISCYKRTYNYFYKDALFSRLDVREISEQDIFKFIKLLKDSKGLKRSSYTNVRNILFSVMRYAFVSGIIVRNPAMSFVGLKAEDLNLPSGGEHKKPNDGDLIYTKEEIVKLYKYAMNANEKNNKKNMMYLASVLLAQTGMRRGELSALPLSDIDLDAKTIKIQHTEQMVLVELPDGTTKNGMVVKDGAKTKAGLRTIPITPEMEKLIAKIIAIRIDSSEYFLSWKNGRVPSAAIDYFLRCLCTQTGVEHKSPHKLRRGYATILAEDEIPDVQIASMLGHGDTNVTRQSYIIPGTNPAETMKNVTKAYSFLTDD